jgi:hypothetical protein
LELSLEEEIGGQYIYMRMRNLNKVGWIKDTVPFSDLRKSPWDYREDKNRQLDIDQVRFISINAGGGPDREPGTYVFYLDELNLFKYQNASEQEQ